MSSRCAAKAYWRAVLAKALKTAPGAPIVSEAIERTDKARRNSNAWRLSNGGGGNPHPGWDATVSGFHPAALAFDGQGRLLAASPASGDLVLVRHGAACLAAAAHTASSSNTGRLASRRTEGQAALDTFALDPAANRCRDRGCRGARPEGEWWWFLLVAVGVLLVTGFCAGGVAYSVLRNRNIRRDRNTTSTAAATASSSGPSWRV